MRKSLDSFKVAYGTLCLNNNLFGRLCVASNARSSLDQINISISSMGSFPIIIMNSLLQYR